MKHVILHFSLFDRRSVGSGFRVRAKRYGETATKPAGRVWPSRVGRILTSGLLVALLTVSVASNAPKGTEPSIPLFRELPETSGLRFVHDNGATGDFFMPEILGSGGAFLDYDNDGDLDIYLVQGAPLTPGQRSPAGNRLFRNDGATADGTPRFTDVTDAAVGLKTVGMGVAVGDVDNDGWLDMYVTAFGSNVLYRNNGNGTFADVTAEAGVDDPRWSTSAAFLDYDRDGDLDLIVVNYVAFTVAGNRVCTDHAGARDYCPPGAYLPLPTRFFRNEGGLRFTDVTTESRLGTAYGAGLGVAIGDFDLDGWLDIYVANDATPNQLWMNRHDGTFEDRALLAGVAVNASGRPEGSMGIAVGDMENDGDEDLFVTNIVAETHALYANDGHGNFDDIRSRSGLAAMTAEMTAFGTDWFDYDHDGLLDLFVANGAVSILERLRGDPFPYRLRNQLFHNEGAGRFADRTAAAGPALERVEVSRAAAFGDVDNDGDIDVLVTNNNGPVRLLLNEANARGGPSTPNWIEIALRSDSGNRFGLGARVGVRVGQTTRWRRARTDGSYLAAGDTRVHVGLGSAARVDGITVEWPDGVRESFPATAADRLVTLRRGTGQHAQ
jgi:enediyne biosynthesis protein E4